jgi:hypothetical protein
MADKQSPNRVQEGVQTVADLMKQAIPVPEPSKPSTGVEAPPEVDLSKVFSIHPCRAYADQRQKAPHNRTCKIRRKMAKASRRINRRRQ